MRAKTYADIALQQQAAWRAERLAKAERDKARSFYTGAREALNRHLISLRHLRDDVIDPRVDELYLEALEARRDGDEERLNACLAIARAMKLRLVALRRRIFSRLDKLREYWLRAKKSHAAAFQRSRELKQEAEALLIRSLGLTSYRTKVFWETNRISLYVGGLDKPDGSGHAHYVLNKQTGALVWAREPLQERGRRVVVA